MTKEIILCSCVFFLLISCTNERNEFGTEKDQHTNLTSSVTTNATRTPRVEISLSPLPVSKQPKAADGTSTPTTTPTFNPTLLNQTYTPIPAATCPKVNSEQVPIPEFLSWSLYEHPKDPELLALEYLNTYGLKPVVAEHSRLVSQGLGINDFYAGDLTNDGQPELLTVIAGWMYIFGCSNGEYVILYEQTEDAGLSTAYRLIEVTDGNLNGIPEIILLVGIATQGGHAYEIIEWDKSYFRDILQTEQNVVRVEATGDMFYRNIDSDRKEELVVENGLPTGETYRYGIPWRLETNYYKWDGYYYQWQELEYDPPKYRFQAVQDGDRYTELGEYDKALRMYQMAIFDDTLEWWSPERQHEEQSAWLLALGGEPTPTAVAQIDLSELHHLVAYAKYRIMLLYLLQGCIDEAEMSYNTLQEEYPAGNDGNRFAEMATVFWNEFQKSASLNEACKMSVEYARTNPRILVYLGSDYHGLQSYEYAPEDICITNAG